MNLTVTIPIVIMEQNFAADVEVTITCRSHDCGNDGPAEGCEWEVQAIGIRRSTSLTTRSGHNGYLTDCIWLKAMIEKSDELAEAVAAAERNEPRGRRARDPDDERERMRDER